MQFYTDPTREQNPHALPDAKTLWLRLPDGSDLDRESYHPDDYAKPEGWYWKIIGRSDGTIVGPFSTEALAVADATGGHGRLCDDRVKGGAA